MLIGRIRRIRRIGWIAPLALLVACTPDQLSEGSEHRGLPKANGGIPGASDYCKGAVQCTSGEGDCDSNAECTAPLVCGRNNGPRFNLPPTFDVCVPAHCTNRIADAGESGVDCGGECGSCAPVCSIPNGQSNSCSLACPCGQGGGDCDSDAECAPGLSCGRDNGTDFGMPSNFDVCVSPEVRMIGAGDIATCGGTQEDEYTAELLDAYFSARTDGIVFAAGDNAYSSGSASEYANCYHPTWGRHKARTRPAVGNHEYLTPNASGYFGYFGAAAGDPTQGWYSYDLGAWHVVVMNTNCAEIGGCNAGSPQEVWLRADLAAHPNACTLAIGHHPRFSSGEHGSDPTFGDLWTALYDGGVDLVIFGHDHDYERFAPMNASGALDTTNGMREIVVGTGGRFLHPFVQLEANREVGDDTTYGVLALTLRATSYEWQFIPIAGSTFTDSGTSSCR